MGIKLTDSDGSKLEEGIYEEVWGGFHRDIYRVFYDGGWKAEGIDGEVCVLDYPRCMPDSALMPAGKLAACYLRYLPEDCLQMLLEKMTRSASREMKKVDLLARYLSGKK